MTRYRVMEYRVDWNGHRHDGELVNIFDTLDAAQIIADDLRTSFGNMFLAYDIEVTDI